MLEVWRFYSLNQIILSVVFHSPTGGYQSQHFSGLARLAELNTFYININVTLTQLRKSLEFLVSLI